MEIGDVAEQVRLLATTRSAWSPSMAPGGERMAVIADLTGVPQVWVVPTAGGWPELVTTFDDPVQVVRWSPTGEWLAVSVAPGGGMNTQIHVVRPDGTDIRRLTDGGLDNNFLGPWRKDGSGLLFSSNRSDPTRTDVWAVDVASGDLAMLAEGRAMVSAVDVSDDGRRVLLRRNHYRGNSDITLLDLDDGTEHVLTAHEGPANNGGAEFGADGTSVWLATDVGGDRVALVRTCAGSEPEVVVGRDDADLEALVVSADRRVAFLSWNEDGRSRGEMIDLATARRTVLPDLGGDVVSGVSVASNGNLLAFSVLSALAPSTVRVLAIGDAAARTIAAPQLAGVRRDGLVAPELVRLTAHDGLPLSGWLYEPSTGGDGRCVVNFHGGPEGQERPTFNPTYQALLSQGISVLGTNIRGSSGFGKRFVNLDNGALRFDAIEDARTCARFLLDGGLAAEDGLGVMGGSYGGYMVMACITEYPELFAAAANLFGMVNFETFFAHTEPWMAAVSKVEYGDPDTELELLRSLSPIHRLDRVVTPTIVLHGANDTNVPVVEAEQVVAHLRRRGVAVEYVLFPDEGHGFVKTANRLTAATSIVSWFISHLRPRA